MRRPPPGKRPSRMGVGARRVSTPADFPPPAARSAGLFPGGQARPAGDVATYTNSRARRWCCLGSPAYRPRHCLCPVSCTRMKKGMTADKQVMDKNSQKMGVIMSGGGARAAYQVGVLKAVARILPASIPNPFPIICGASAGAINAAALAVYADNFQNAVRRLERVWGNFHVHQVFRVDARGMLGNWAKWWASFLTSGFGGRQYPMSMFDRTPLRDLLDRYIPWGRIQTAIDRGWREALSISVSGYSSGQSVSFFQGKPEIAPWKRAARLGVAADSTTRPLMA